MVVNEAVAFCLLVHFERAATLAAIAKALSARALSGAPYLGRGLLKRIGANRHPAWRVAMAISLVTPRRGEANFETVNAILAHVMKDETAEGRLHAWLPPHWPIARGSGGAGGLM